MGERAGVPDSPRGQQTASLRRKLDEKAAAADELIEALHELRQVLDVENLPLTMRRRPRRARRSILLLVCALAVTTLTLSFFRDRDSNATNPPSATQPTSAAQPTNEVHPPGLTTTGPGVSVPGTDVQVAVDPDGRHLDVFERALLNVPDAEPLSLATAAATLPALHTGVQVQDLQVQLDDYPIDIRTDGHGGWRADPPARTTYTRVTLRYRVSGGIALVTPAAPGRALGVITPLTGLISSDRGYDVQVRTTDATVLGVSCPTTGRGAVCGTHTDKGWVATVPTDARPLVVLLQLNTKK